LLPVAAGPVDSDQGHQNADQKEDQHHVLNKLLPVAAGPVDCDQGHQNADQKEDQHHVLNKSNVLQRKNLKSFLFKNVNKKLKSLFFNHVDKINQKSKGNEKGKMLKIIIFFLYSIYLKIKTKKNNFLLVATC
jgi:hypothetical protein